MSSITHGREPIALPDRSNEDEYSLDREEGDYEKGLEQERTEEADDKDDRDDS